MHKARFKDKIWGGSMVNEVTELGNGLNSRQKGHKKVDH